MYVGGFHLPRGCMEKQLDSSKSGTEKCGCQPLVLNDARRHQRRLYTCNVPQHTCTDRGQRHNLNMYVVQTYTCIKLAYAICAKLNRSYYAGLDSRRKCLQTLQPVSPCSRLLEGRISCCGGREGKLHAGALAAVAEAAREQTPPGMWSKLGWTYHQTGWTCFIGRNIFCRRL